MEVGICPQCRKACCETCFPRKQLSHDEAMMVLARRFAEQDARGEHLDIRKQPKA